MSILLTVLVVSLIILIDQLEYKWEYKRRVIKRERKHYRTYRGNHYDTFD